MKYQYQVNFQCNKNNNILLKGLVLECFDKILVFTFYISSWKNNSNCVSLGCQPRLYKQFKVWRDVVSYLCVKTHVSDMILLFYMYFLKYVRVKCLCMSYHVVPMSPCPCSFGASWFFFFLVILLTICMHCDLDLRLYNCTYG